MFQNRKRHSKAGKVVLKQQKVDFFSNFVTKSVQKCDRTSHTQNEPHARTSRTLFKMDFARTRTRATAHRTCACAHAPSQLIPWISPAFNGITYKQFYYFQNYLGAAKGILRKVTLFAQDEEFCKRFYTSANYSTQFCAGGERGENKSNGGIHNIKVIIC